MSYLNAECDECKNWDEINWMINVFAQEEFTFAQKVEALAHYRRQTATRMRDRCVEKVREMRSGWEKELQYEEDFDWRVDTATEIITALQSLTLEGEQEK